MALRWPAEGIGGVHRFEESVEKKEEKERGRERKRKKEVEKFKCVGIVICDLEKRNIEKY